ncbi:FkbM family methyltransferase [Pseudoflavitalea rhizosphaerae]|uniref:FkbM family methyltransferase n=1 Tax=Pseudoflavitalea rhizosphaerae TaxID=1884793 RepID=UPI000F8D8C67|nr:FkbM family methyltransferase [Pseudoflavitalea rhizosphaerae]
MSIRSSVKKSIENVTGLKLYRKLPFGQDPIEDIRHIFREYRFTTLFDVGAIIGQSARYFVANVPGGNIYCFEPSAEAFGQLKEAMKERNNVQCFQQALGNCQGQVKMVNHERSDMNKIVQEDQGTGDSRTEMVAMDTLANFCQKNKIPRISYLKIDTEGFDLEVLKSGSEMLERSAIDFIEVEVGMNPTNKHHVPIEEVKRYLESYGYYIFGVYEQVQEWITRKPFLRRVNALFISEQLAK